MKRFGAAVVCASALVTFVSAGTASAERPPYGPPEGAAGPPVGSCPTNAGWSLVVPSGPEHLSAAYDFNFDNHVCARFNPGGGLVFMDNVVR